MFRGEKVGIVGANGCGKSSLLALVLGELHAEAGRLRVPVATASSAWVAQEMAALDSAAIEFVMDGDTELRETEAAIRRAEAAR